MTTMQSLAVLDAVTRRRPSPERGEVVRPEPDRARHHGTGLLIHDQRSLTSRRTAPRAQGASLMPTVSDLGGTMRTMRIRTLAGPSLPHELLADTVRAIVLSDTTAGHCGRAPASSPRLRNSGAAVMEPTRSI